MDPRGAHLHHKNSDAATTSPISKRKTDYQRRPPRKRAANACLACRARKVRCDVTLRGSPCMNCYLDHEDCVVKGRPSKYRVLKHCAQVVDENTAEGSHVKEFRRDTEHEGAIQRRPSAQYNSQEQPLTPISEFPTHSYTTEKLGASHRSDFDGVSSLPEEDLSETPWHSHERPSENQQDPTPSLVLSSVEIPTDTAKDIARCSETQRPLHNNSLVDDSEFLPSHDPYVSYTQYPFLRFDKISDFSAQDIEFMKLKGAFLVPSRRSLNDFVEQFFLHVHPYLPLFDEGDFWDMFSENYTQKSAKSRMSLFTFQAMLFTSCSFVPVSTLRDIGFPSNREARTAFYRRAKVLFDFGDGEKDCVSTAQGALLLSYHSPNSHIAVNTFWLGIGIHYARYAGAHRYQSSPNPASSQKMERKRLWWSCILRDRILPLGVRRPLQITSEQFDFTDDPLTTQDLEGEVHRSKVYDPTTKRSLIELLIVLCDLAVRLTDMILIVYPLINGGSSISKGTRLALGSQIERCKSSLDEWYENTASHFPTPAGLGDAHESVVLYTNLVYIYYHSARIAICHHEALMWEISARHDDRYTVQRYKSRQELQDSIAGITDNTKELIQLKLAKYLPISAVAYTALPLLLHTIDVKLSSSKFQMSIKQRRLEIYTEVMKVYQARYDGADNVSEAIREVMEYLKFDNPLKAPDQLTRTNMNVDESAPRDGTSTIALCTTSVPVVNDWSDVFMRQPGCYLRIALTLDLYISRGSYPKDQDFPAILQASNRLSTVFPLYKTNFHTICNGEYENRTQNLNRESYYSAIETNNNTTNANNSGKIYNLDIDESPTSTYQSESETQFDPMLAPGSPGDFAAMGFGDPNLDILGLRDVGLDSTVFEMLDFT